MGCICGAENPHNLVFDLGRGVRLPCELLEVRLRHEIRPERGLGLEGLQFRHSLLTIRLTSHTSPAMRKHCSRHDPTTTDTTITARHAYRILHTANTDTRLG